MAESARHVRDIFRRWSPISQRWRRKMGMSLSMKLLWATHRLATPRMKQRTMAMIAFARHRSLTPQGVNPSSICWLLAARIKRSSFTRSNLIKANVTFSEHSQDGTTDPFIRWRFLRASLNCKGNTVLNTCAFLRRGVTSSEAPREAEAVTSFFGMSRQELR